MKPVLVIGLGNSLMGDDGVGWHVAQGLAADPRLSDDVEVIPGGTDLLRWASEIEGRRKVLIVDAMLEAGAPRGAGFILRRASARLPGASRHAHDLSAVEAIQLLRRFLSVPIVLLTVSIASSKIGETLSPEISAALPSIVDRVLEESRRSAPRIRGASLSER